MRRRFFQALEEEEVREPNISPLIDIVFLLLIFFMVTTVFVDETGLEVVLPEARSAQSVPKEVIRLGVKGDEVWHEGKALQAGELPIVLTTLLRADPERPVVVEADEGTPTGTTVAVLDQARQAGAKSVSLAAKTP